MIEMKDVMKKYSNGTTAIRNISVEMTKASSSMWLVPQVQEINLY